MSFAHDLTLAIRSARRSPLFTFVVVLTLALGIGAATAVFTVADAVIVRGLPYANPDRIVRVSEAGTLEPGGHRELSWPDYLDVEATRGIFSAVGGYGFSGGVRIDNAEGPARIQGAAVTPNFFDVLGVTPAVGRTFRTNEDQLGSARVMLLSHAYWKNRFHGSTAVLGTALPIEGRSIEIIGVLPEGFHFAPVGDPDVWIAMVPSESQRERRYMHWIKPVARLAPGVTLERAEAALRPLFASFHEPAPGGTPIGVSLTPIREVIVGKMKPVVLALFGAAMAVLLIACVNVANLLVARSSDREVEIATRAALGGSRGRIVRQFVGESLLLGALGAIAGLGLAKAATSLLIRSIPAGIRASMPYLDGVRISPASILFAVVATLLATALFGTLSAIQAYHSTDLARLRSGARIVGRSGALRAGLIALEIALCLALVIGSGLLVRSAAALANVDPGFERDHLLTMTVELPRNAYDSDARAASFFDTALDRVEALPGVTSAALVDKLPLTGSGNTGGPTVVGRPDPPSPVSANLRAITRNYFETMRIPLLAGRTFLPDETADRAPVAIVSDSLARRLIPNGDIVGERVRFVFMDEDVTIVGVVGDENVVSIDSEAEPVMYFHWLSEPGTSASVVVRTTGDPSTVANAVAGSFTNLESQALVHSVRSMQQMIHASPALFLRRYPLELIGTFAAVALVLATIGIYGIVAYSVSRRTREFGIRIALGATGANVMRLVLRQAARLGAFGVALGLVIAIPTTRLLSALLFGVTRLDPLTWIAAASLLLGTAVAAALSPALRATRTTPAEALRDE